MHLGAAAALCEPLISFPIGVEGYDMSLLYFLCESSMRDRRRRRLVVVVEEEEEDQEDEEPSGVFVGLVGLVQSAVAMGIVAGIDMFKVHPTLSLASLLSSKSLFVSVH